eukprot:COSAG01_NODE_565_length_15436_cov_64.116581_7_plen_66_part_00
MRTVSSTCAREGKAALVYEAGGGRVVVQDAVMRLRARQMAQIAGAGHVSSVAALTLRLLNGPGPA